MAEKKIVYQDKFVQFEGLFDLRELFRIIIKWCTERNYDMYENRNYEEVYEDGKKIIFELLPYRKVSDYHKLEMRVFAVFAKLKEVEVELNGVKRKLMKGKADITFDAILVTDYENRWEGRPYYFFYRALVDKFIYKAYTDRFEAELIKEVQDLQEEIKAYLNMFRYSPPPSQDAHTYY